MAAKTIVYSAGVMRVCLPSGGPQLHRRSLAGRLGTRAQADENANVVPPIESLPRVALGAARRAIVLFPQDPMKELSRITTVVSDIAEAAAQADSSKFAERCESAWRDLEVEGSAAEVDFFAQEDVSRAPSEKETQSAQADAGAEGIDLTGSALISMQTSAEVSAICNEVADLRNTVQKNEDDVEALENDGESSGALSPLEKLKIRDACSALRVRLDTLDAGRSRWSSASGVEDLEAAIVETRALLDDFDALVNSK